MTLLDLEDEDSMDCYNLDLFSSAKPWYPIWMSQQQVLYKWDTHGEKDWSGRPDARVIDRSILSN